MTPLAQQQITVEKEEVKGMSQPKNTLRTTKNNVKLPFSFQNVRKSMHVPQSFVRFSF